MSYLKVSSIRYYTNGAGGHFSHHVLIDDDVIRLFMNNNMSSDMFCSVQSYDIHGNEYMSQLVFDIDNEDIVVAYDIAKSIADDVEYKYDTDTSIWFSGSKGFHVITGLVGHGDKANIAMKSIAFNISREIDPAMYKSRSLFRLPNTRNSKSGLFKIQVKYNESIKSIYNRAMSQQAYEPIEYDLYNSKFSVDHITSLESVNMVTQHDHVNITHSDWRETLSPCISTMLDEGVQEGFRYEVCFYLVRHFRICGLDIDEAIDVASTLDVFSDGGYSDGMIAHYYSGMIRNVGCLTGTLSSYMQSRCVSSCVHSKEFIDGVARNFTSIIQ